MPTIPKFSSSATKLIRTTEGWIVVAFNVAMLVVPIVTSTLSAGTAVKWAAIVDSATVLARQFAKGLTAIQTPLMDESGLTQEDPPVQP